MFPNFAIAATANVSYAFVILLRITLTLLYSIQLLCSLPIL